MARSDMAGSQAYWTATYGHYPLTPEEVAAELHDWYVALHEVPKVYGELTGWRFTKPNTTASVILEAAREDRARDEAEAVAEVRAELAEALESCRATLTLSSRDMSMSKDTAWLYGVLVGWEDAEEDPEGGALAEIVARFALTPEAVERMRRLHAVVERALAAPAPGGDVNREAIDALNRMAGR